jgi:phospholipid/cholesterol/gamma-HCH transport system ATP-binding protein
MPDSHFTSNGAAESEIIRLVNVHKSFGRQRVLQGVNMTFRRGRTTVVLGPSGSGKSVTLKLIVGLLKPRSGEVWYEQARVDKLSEAELIPIRREIGFLFQQGALFDSMTVGQNIHFPLHEHSDLSPEQARQRIIQVLRMVGLADTIDKMPADLSGGQRKRIALARAIVLFPKVILYDEPTTGLDPIRFDVTSIVVTHDIASAFKVADDLLMLHEGKVILSGSVQDFKTTNDPIVRRFLEGEATPEEVAAIRQPAPVPPARNNGGAKG